MLKKTSLTNQLKRISNNKSVLNIVGQSSKPAQIQISNLNEWKRVEQIGYEFFSSKTNEFFSVVDRNCLNLAPILLKQENLDEFERLQSSLHRAIIQLVSNYHNDERIRAVFRFRPRIDQILLLYKNLPFQSVGSYRPDFLYEQSTCTPKLCEINARFVLNGYLITLFGNEFYSTRLDFFSNSACFQTIEQTKHILKSFQNEFNMSKPIVVLKKREKGNDILFMQNLFPNVIVSSPESLKFDKTNRRLFLNSQPEQTLDQFILELHQDEILTFDDSVLRFLVESCKLLNDLRTVFIVHDKRFLTLLCQDDLLDDYLNKSEHETIRKHRLVSLDPSRLNYDRNLRERVLKEREWWLVKPRQYGKGEGIIFGKNVSQLEWTELIAHVVNSDEFILQECLIQEKFEITRHQSQSGIDKISVVDFRLVGTLLCLNEQFLGPGIFRASSQDLITLKQGADVLFPIKERPNSKTLQTSQLPLLNIQTQYEPLEVPEQAKFILKTCSFENVGNYENALLKHGIVLIQFDSNENILSNGFFLSLIRHLGEPFTHSKMVHDFIWNIKPSQSNLNRPRSQTDEEFQMHTDASFEPIPPRYFALYVLKSDRFGGGQSLLLDLESILERLTKKEMSLLMNTAVKFEIPQEFRKDENEFTMGSILSPRRDSMNRILCRYRRDVIMNREQMSSDYKKALRKFEQIIDLERGRNRIKSLMLQKNSILIVDNSIWIHGRTKIFDPNRHLARIRFQTRNSLLLPW